MATNEPNIAIVNDIAKFEIVANRIRQTFDSLITQLADRRDHLLEMLFRLRDDYTSKETNRMAAFTELETAEQIMLKTTLKFNRNISTKLDARKVYQKGLRDQETPTKFPHPQFQTPTLQKLQSLIAEFGEVSEWNAPDYSLKKEPILAVGKRGNGAKEFNFPAGLAIDEAKQRIYISDRDNSRVQVMSCQGEFVKRFGKDILRFPWGIAAREDHIYVTDSGQQALFQFRTDTFKLANRTGTEGIGLELNRPRGLCIDTNGDVFVANEDNDRVSIFTEHLAFKSFFAIGQLDKPQDVKLTPECVVVLDRSSKCLHYFSRNGDLLSSCITQGGGQEVDSPSFFCLDPAGNVFISDLLHHVVKIFSRSGQLVHSVGRLESGRGELIGPLGISVSKLGIIYVVSDNPSYCLHCF